MSRSTLVYALLVFVSASTTSGWPFHRRDVLDNSVDSPEGVIAHLQHFGEVLYRFPDNATGEIVANWHEGMDRNPEELGSYAEGDILFPPQLAKNGLKAESARWPGGVVPYVLSPYFNAEQRKVITDAMNDYHKYTCIKFKPYKGEESDYVRITAGNSGCWSSVGRIGGRQDVNLQVPGCLVKKGTVIHELMHVIGFLHEQSRYERDEFVSIQWNNILSGHSGNFEKASKRTTDAFGVGYDYGSVMHYSANAFSRNGQPTIVPKGASKNQLGQREGFSKRDIQKIRKMYKCNKRRRSYS
ncbi:zinc metalloproteinase nas-4-like [Hylaeus volcanicus]|uniref:zinc metalloproteinase nas-4-like n=1 Tax=Hylaeus volcanicus TaxID=313075 RepID=UPI0023B7AD80|nr:zinc metalloproteinase nas-4-like [Hylaeus volcanicus]